MGAGLTGMAQHGGVLPVGGTFFVLLRLHAPGRPARRADGLARRVRRGPTTPSAWARTGRPTSRSSTWPRCGPCRASACIRPADANETAQAWRLAVEAEGPVGLLLTRQDVPVLAGTADAAPRGRGAGRLRPVRARPATLQIVLVAQRERGPALRGRRARRWPARASRRAWCPSRRGTSSSGNPRTTAPASSLRSCPS